MNGRGSPKDRFLELVKYFGFAIISVVVLVVAFLIISKSISARIQEISYQALEEAAREESATLQKYFDLLTTQTSLIAEHEAEEGPKQLVETLRKELAGSAVFAQIGFANPYGYLIYSDQPKINVSGEAWFGQSKNLKTHIFLLPKYALDAQKDILISAPVHSVNGTSGVLFLTLDGAIVSEQIHTQAFGGKANTVICDASGAILFCETGLADAYLGKNLFELTSQIEMRRNTGVAGLAAALKRGLTAGFSYESNGIPYYAVTVPTGVLDWQVVTFIDGDTADVVQRQVNAYLLGMLTIMLAVGVFMTIQAYAHEQSTVRKLENDKELIRQSAQRYKIITQLSNEVLFHVDLQSGEISFNDNFEGMFGFPPPSCSVNQIENCLPLFLEADQHGFISMMNRLRAGAEEAHEELRMVHARGIVHWKRIEIYTMFDQGGQSIELIGKIVDIHRQKQSMQRLIRQVDSEPLTGLLNRGAMERNIKSFLSGEGLHGRHALLMMDFDNFKAVNDTLGHAKGDDLLVSFASAIRRVFRAGDLSSRVGGDEYMVFLKNVREEGIAQEKAEALREEMKGLSRKIGVAVSVSIGIALYQQDGETFEQLYRAADKALYHVKNSGKNRVAFYASLSEAQRNSN